MTSPFLLRILDWTDSNDLILPSSMRTSLLALPGFSKWYAACAANESCNVKYRGAYLKDRIIERMGRIKEKFQDR